MFLHGLFSKSYMSVGRKFSDFDQGSEFMFVGAGNTLNFGPMSRVRMREKNTYVIKISSGNTMGGGNAQIMQFGQMIRKFMGV